MKGTLNIKLYDIENHKFNYFKVFVQIMKIEPFSINTVFIDVVVTIFYLAFIAETYRILILSELFSSIDSLLTLK